MALPISFHPAVEELDLFEIFVGVAERTDVEFADGVLDEIRKVFHQIARQPFIGPKYRIELGGLEDIRMFPVIRYQGRFIVFYRVDPDQIRILYVFRAARDIPERMSKDLRT